MTKKLKHQCIEFRFNAITYYSRQWKHYSVQTFEVKIKKQVFILRVILNKIKNNTEFLEYHVDKENMAPIDTNTVAQLYCTYLKA